MDITQDYTALVRDNTTRKSLGRRVSFAAHSHVRMFETNNTNGSSTPSSDPISPEPPQPQSLSNENDYPGQSSRRRRSSVRYSLAESEDMDLTSIAPGGMVARGSAILDEEFDYDDDDEYDDADMDVTEAIRGDFARKRSLSIGGRRPLSQLQSPSQQHLNEADESRSDNGNESFQSGGISEQSEQSMAMEFTIPLGQSLKPADQDQAWLALKQMTHSGNDPSEPELSSDDGMTQEAVDMNLDDAMERLRRARQSLPSSHQTESQTNEGQDDTFTSTEDSFDDPEDGNKTLNLSVVLGRVSLGPNSRMSLGYQESNMDESEIYGNIASSIPRPSFAPQPPSSPDKAPKPTTQPSVFQPPREAPTSRASIANIAPTPKPSVAFSFTPRAQSPTKSIDTSKTKPKSTFSAAFAPPVARKSPKKAAASPGPPIKRSRPSHQDDVETDDDQPSPAKRQAFSRKLSDIANQPKDNSLDLHSSSAPKAAAPTPRPFSPSKKAPFSATTASAPEATSRPSSALRRPSGYFAKRKSLAVGFNSASTDNKAATIDNSSTHKKPGYARASMGSAPPDAWTRFNKESGLGTLNQPGASKSGAEEKGPNASVQEAERQINVMPSPTRSSPAPAQSVYFAEPIVEPRESSPEPQKVTSTIEHDPETEDLSGKMEIDKDATQHWREGVQQIEYEEDEEEVVRSYHHIRL